MGAFKQYIVGRSSEATFADAFEKQEAIIRYLGGFDATGEVGYFSSLCSSFCGEVILSDRNVTVQSMFGVFSLV